VLLVAVAACLAAGIAVSRAVDALRIPLAQFSELKLVALFASVLGSALLRFMYSPALTTKPILSIKHHAAQVLPPLRRRLPTTGRANAMRRRHPRPLRLCLLQRIYPRCAVDSVHARVPGRLHNDLLACSFTGSAVVRHLQCRAAGHAVDPAAAAAAAQLMAERRNQVYRRSLYENGYFGAKEEEEASYGIVIDCSSFCAFCNNKQPSYDKNTTTQDELKACHLRC
jgi:hypothetical protein